MKILVLGGTGQVGHILLNTLAMHHPRLITYWPRIDLTSDPRYISSEINAISPDLIVNCAAYTDVDRAESEPQRAMAINAVACEGIARAAALRDIPLIHFSTDYVYAGKGDQPQAEDANLGPANVYGLTKLMGEHVIRQIAPHQAIILRTSWVYSLSVKSFLGKIMKVGSENEVVRVVADQIGAPTPATFLADEVVAIIQKLESNACFKFAGTYNLCCQGAESWCEFTRLAFDLRRPRACKTILPIPSEMWPSPARRPLNSRLDTWLYQETFGRTPLHWMTALRTVLTA